MHFDVIDNRFQLRWDVKIYVGAAIAPDGTGDRRRRERITLVGKQTGPKIEGDVTNGDCGLHFTVIQAIVGRRAGAAHRRRPR